MEKSWKSSELKHVIAEINKPNQQFSETKSWKEVTGY
jgi:hypothetical protein